MDPDTNIFFTQIRSSPWHILAFFGFGFIKISYILTTHIEFHSRLVLKSKTYSAEKTTSISLKYYWKIVEKFLRTF